MGKDNLNTACEINDEKYLCAICGKSYKTIEERAKCELECIRKRKEAEKALREKKLRDEQEARRTEIEQKWKELISLVGKYERDYGAYCSRWWTF